METSENLAEQLLDALKPPDQCPTCGISGGTQHRIETKDHILIVKGESHQQADEAALARYEDMPPIGRYTRDCPECDLREIETELNKWLIEDRDPPFPSGALLWWRRYTTEAEYEAEAPR